MYKLLNVRERLFFLLQLQIGSGTEGLMKPLQEWTDIANRGKQVLDSVFASCKGRLPEKPLVQAHGCYH